MQTLMHYWIQLGLHEQANAKEILAAWRALPVEKQTPELKLFVKANLDRYYEATLRHYPDLNQLLPAGFFDDLREPALPDYDLDYFTTPVHKIMHNILAAEHADNTKPYVVLLNTGSYSPIHLGHILMMNEARTALSEHYHVVGGYFSPSHDIYVSSKYNGTAKLDIDSRIALCEEVVAESEWLMVDPWEARYNECSINFTDVIIRLEKYLAQHLKKTIQIAYVFGSDNAGFSWAFVEQGLGVCFERPGSELQFNTVRHDPLLQNERHYFIENKGNTYSSKAIREGHTEFLPEKIQQLYSHYKEQHYPIHTPLYLVRNDYAFASRNFNKEKNLKPALLQLSSDLQSAIKKAFLPYCTINVMTLDVEHQNALLNQCTDNILNIDGCTWHPKQKSIAVSRLFALSDGQVFAPELIARPGSASLSEQIQYIEPGSYTLVDDDIASGRTIELIRQLLPASVHIQEYMALSRQSFHEIYDLSYRFHDIVDFRDFLIGAHDGGLVIELPNGEVGRAPYLWPYVSLVHRAKIPPREQAQFCQDILHANLIFYNNLETTYRIKDTDLYFQNLACYLGFDKDMLVTDFIEWHLNRMIH